VCCGVVQKEIADSRSVNIGVLQCVLRCVLHCVAVICSVLQCVAEGDCSFSGRQN